VDQDCLWSYLSGTGEKGKAIKEDRSALDLGQTFADGVFDQLGA
jgi:hypothetical protein